MNSKLPCHIVRDLLPNYADGLLSPESEAEVKAHLEECEECRAVYRQMTGPEPEPQISEDAAEVDYLKKYQRRRKSILIAAVIFALLVAGAAAVNAKIRAAKADINYDEVSKTMVVYGKDDTNLRLPETIHEATELDAQFDTFHVRVNLPMLRTDGLDLAEYLPAYLGGTNESLKFIRSYLNENCPDIDISERAAKYVDLSNRSKRDTIRRKIAANNMKKDTIGEELRLLYVAMTRAMQKLIIVGAQGKKGYRPSDWVEQAASGQDAYPDHYIASARKYMDYVYPAALRCQEHFVITEPERDSISNGNVVSGADPELEKYRTLLSPDPSRVTDDGIKEELEYCYPYINAETLPVKLSVSDIKHAAMDEEGVEKPWENAGGSNRNCKENAKRGERDRGDDSGSEEKNPDDSFESIVHILENKDKNHDDISEYGEKHPDNSGNGEKNTDETAESSFSSISEEAGPAASRLNAAERGTLYHKVMQFLPFSLETVEEVGSFLDHMAGAGSPGKAYNTISQIERGCLDEEAFAAFLKTDLCCRMRIADEAGALWREQPFMMGISACEIDPEKYKGREELIPVQGIIDCMFEEDGELVIVDYKTDHVEAENGAAELKKRYHRQLELYARAAGTICGKRVKEKAMYSFALGEVVEVQ